MTSSSLINDYIGRGVIADRPTAPNVSSGCTALYYATDTLNFYYWSGAAWVLFASGGGGSIAGGSDHSAQFNNSGLLDGAVLTNGQLLVGSTGADPVAASITAPAAGLTVTGGAGSITFALANDLAALEALASTGLAARTGASTWAQRTIAGTASNISLTNGDGVSGNPTVDLINTAVTPGSYTATDLTVDAKGRITAAANGSGGGGAGALTLLETKTASNSASLAFTNPITAVNVYKLVGQNLVPATDNVGASIVFGSGGTPTYATANYFLAGRYVGSGGGAADVPSASRADFPAGMISLKNAAPGISFDFTIETDGTWVIIHGTSWELGTDGAHYINLTGGSLNLGAVLTGIKIAATSGNITSGKFSLYSVTQ